MSKKISEKEQKKEKKQKKVKIKAGRLARREAWMGVIFISPWIVGALMFLLYPMIESFDFALNNIRITAMGMRFTPVGYGNFTQILLSNPEFVPNLVNYVVSTVISVPVIVVFALIISIMLNQNNRHDAPAHNACRAESFRSVTARVVCWCIMTVVSRP